MILGDYTSVKERDIWCNMGYNREQWNFVTKSLENTFHSYSDKLMLELGNQRIKQSMFPELQNKVAKHVFESIGFKHTSFDINGKDGALKIDLSKTVKDERYVNVFDVVTNIGTSEHIEPYKRQYECFKNIHLCSKIGGIMIHIVPEVGSFYNHCANYYSVDFFEHLSKLNDYKISYLERIHFVTNKQTGDYFVAACLVKVNNKFCEDRQEVLKYITRVKCTRDGIKK